MENLRPWEKGQSGNKAGRPVGSKNLKTLIIKTLKDDQLLSKLPLKNKYVSGTTPIEAILSCYIVKALDGDLRSAEIILKSTFKIIEIETKKTDVLELFSEL